MSSSELHTLQKAFTAAGGHWSTFVIWAKDRFTLGRSDCTNRSFMDGLKETIISGAARGIRATFGS
jgi:hypothetical protein